MDMSRSSHFAAGIGMPPVGTPEYAEWHGRWSSVVRQDQRTGQVNAAKAHIAEAAKHRANGEPGKASRSLQRAAVERSIATRMPRA